MDELNNPTRKAENKKRFKPMLTEFLNLKQNFSFAIRDFKSFKLLTRLRLRFSHLNEHKFLHDLKGIPNPMNDCNSEIETTNHFFLLCLYFAKDRHKLFNSLFEINLSLRNLNNE